MRIGARGSDLARVQANMIELLLKNAGFDTEMVIISTHGDRIQNVPLNQLGVQGVFTKEIEEALLNNQIDLAVHSFKDVASIQPGGLEIVAVTEREDCADLLVINRDAVDDAAPFCPIATNCIVGTSAVRRSTQIKALRNDLITKDLRGNVPTRIEKLANGQYDAIFLASAGVNRLGLDISRYQVCRLDPTHFVPSPGQGALAIEMRVDDPAKEKVRELLHHSATFQATVLERGLLKKFGGGCSLPLGALAKENNGHWSLHAFWGGALNPVWSNLTGENVDQLIVDTYNILISQGL